MKKHSKKKNWLRLLFVLIIIVFIGLLSIFIINKATKFLPIYKIDSRIKDLKKYKNEYGNIEAIGWIKIQGTNIDYPVLNNNSDLDIEKIVDNFAWTQGDLDKFPNKLFILGHNIRNVSSNPIIGNKEHTRFEQLPSYIYYDFVKENKYIQYTMDEKDYLYKIFSVSIVEDSTLDYLSQDYTEEEMKSYIEQSKKDSYFDFDIEVDKTDKVISLITCTRFFGATTDYTFKIDARLLRKNEPTNNYGVSKNKNYAQIEEMMRGDQDEQEV